jgi:L,D-transpeptidase YcbB
MLNHLRIAGLGLLLASPSLPGSAASPGPQLAYQLGAQVAVPLAPQWQPAAAADLLAFVEGIAAEGLDPAAYAPDRLRTALAAGDPVAASTLASEIFLRLAGDLSGGYVRGSDRRQWFMRSSALGTADAHALLASAMQGRPSAALSSLLPTHPQYGALKRALAATPESDRARRDLIRTNLDRWRWMPRDLGRRHVMVNVPAFSASLVEDGQVAARHKVIVGATRTPTPQLDATITGITFNPWWTVPQSIIREMRSFRGYEVRQGDGFRIVRQPPGPANALGRVKFEMQNDHAIYLHDTPAQALFARDVRAFSHGCIRTQLVRDLAALLLAPTGRWDRAAIDRAIDTGRTTLAPLAEPVPVYIAYFTAVATEGGNLVTYPDLYGRDAPVRQALNRTPGGITPQLAAFVEE